MKDKKWFIIILVCTFFLLLVLNFLTPMLADDYRYLYSYATQKRITSISDIFSSMVAHATIMNGRVIPHFFDQLFLMLPSPIFKLINTCVYLFFLFGIYRLVKDESVKHDWKLLLIIDGALFLLPPVFGQVYLWQTGSVSYLWRDTLMVWVLSTFANVIFKNKPIRSIGKTTMLALSSLYICNSTENGAVGILFMMLLCFGWLAFQKRTIPLALLISFAFGLLGLILLFFAPAGLNNLKATTSGLGGIFDNYQRAFSMWISYALWPSIAFIIFFFTASAGVKFDRDRLAFSMGLFLTSLVCNFAMSAAPYYPLRAIVISINLIIIACFIAIGEIRMIWKIWFTRILNASFALLFVLQAISALPWAYDRYQLSQARLALIQEQRESGTEDIITFGILGKSRYDAFFDLHELTDDSNYFPNVYFAKYYDLRTIVVDRFEK